MAFLRSGCRRSSSAIYEPCCGTVISDRHQCVKIRTRVQNTLQAIALNHALRRGRGLWTATGQKALQALSLPGYTRQRRDELLLSGVIDSMTMSAASPGINFGGANQPRPGERSQHDHHRMRLPSGLPTNCLCRHRNGRTERATAGASRAGGEVLPRTCWTRKKHSSGNGSQWTRTLVRAPAGGTEHRAVDWGCRQDPSQAGTQKEDRSRGREAYSGLAAEG